MVAPLHHNVQGLPFAGNAAFDHDDVVVFSHFLPTVRLGDTNRAYFMKNSRMVDAISAAWVSSAKCPVSKKRTTAFGMSRLNASAPCGRKNGSFLPHTARNGGLYVRKYFWKLG